MTIFPSWHTVDSVSLCLAWSVTKQASDIFLLLTSHSVFLLAPLHSFFRCSVVLKLWQNRPPYGSLSGILSVIWLSPLSPEKFSSVFFFQLLLFSLLWLHFQEPQQLYVYFSHLLFSLTISSLIFLQCGRTAQDCLAQRSHHSEVPILISKVDFNYVIVSLFFLNNPFLFHLAPFHSLIILYLYLGTPISFMPHLLYIILRRVKKNVNISPVSCNKSPYRSAPPLRLEMMSLYFIMEFFSMATYYFFSYINP